MFSKMFFTTGWSGLKKGEKALIIYGIVISVLTLAVGCLYLGKLWGRNEYKELIEAEYQAYYSEPDAVPQFPGYYYTYEENRCYSV